MERQRGRQHNLARVFSLALCVALAAVSVPAGAQRIVWSSPPRVSIRGIGPVRIGMSVAAARTVAGPLARERSESEECFYVMPSRARQGISFMVTGGRIARIDVTSPDYSTMRGARVGQPEADVLRLYGGALAVTGHKYEELGHYLTFIPRDAADRGYRLVFETDGKVVTSFRVGRLPEVEYVESCL